MASKPSIPKGTRDFSPTEVAKRQYIIQIIKSNFEKFGFQPIETPSFENSETLMGKYGEEGDRLIFKILNSGEYVSKFNDTLVEFIRFSIIYHKDYLKKKNESFDMKDYDFLYKKNLATYLKSKNLYIFKDATVSEIELLDDVFYFILKRLKKDDLLSKADSEFDDFVKIIFADFYYELKYKYLTSYISEKALRYDLTVPFARYVVQHQNEIEFPFKRYQIQPVWRADRPQKGRFREFFQCDADVVGSKSLWQEVELVQLYDTVFTALGLNAVTIKINNRKILSGIAEVIGASDKLIDFTVALDKLDKIGEDGVKKEMMEKGISEEAILKVQPLFSFTGTISEKITQLSVLLSESEEGMKGVEELRFICENVIKLGLSNSILDLDVTLARGLNYYTGAIFEVAPPKSVAMGSIGGGGRYDDLTGIFGLKNMSGVGISFGLDRIYLVVEELNLFPETVTATSKALFINYGDKEAFYALQAIQKLRASGIKVEFYPDNTKVAKQFQHADKRGIPYAVIIGEQEMASNSYLLKNLITGEQVSLNFENLRNALS
ncbi:histidine--tRNA ligase [Flavobacterium urumqiense]|uniref:Histidine--tRNA ligase n=1 Tax=Flavobacterium urumqiense TaxID=935224 RepID=A0A1H5X421_9FLAO|nr:histidine--tRNA ligase [Flavobacterium urumqiense]SEG06323.1 histidyl-tRNA synthetase [Flavobacterium urumqiense]